MIISLLCLHPCICRYFKLRGENNTAELYLFNPPLCSKHLFSFIKFSLSLPPAISAPFATQHENHHVFLLHVPPSSPRFILLFRGLNLIISCCREKSRTHTVGTACGKRRSREGRTAFVLPSAGRLQSCQWGPKTHGARKTQKEKNKNGRQGLNLTSSLRS